MSVAGRLSLFFAVYAAGMWISKIAQPIYFDERGAVLAFGIGYSVMAVAGGLSFVWGALADRWGGSRTMTLGAVVYAVGILLRVEVALPVVVLSGAVAGAGASLVLVGVRPWIRRRVDDDGLGRVVAARHLGNQAGLVAGSLGVAAVFALLGPEPGGPRSALLLAPVLVLVALIPLRWRAGPEPRPRPAVPAAEVSGADAARHGRSAAVAVGWRLAVVAGLSGLYISLVAPYLPLILVQAGGTSAQVSFLIALAGVVQVGATALMSRFDALTRRPLPAFVASEMLCAAALLALAGLLGLSAPGVVVVLIVRSALVAVATVSEEIVQFAVIPAAVSGLVFGVVQSVFLVGDALGGLLGAVLWQAHGATGLLLVSGALVLVNSLLVPLLLRSRLRAAQGAAASSGSTSAVTLG